VLLELGLISTVTPNWLQTVQNTYDNDEFAQGLLSKLVLSDSSVPNYTLHNGILKYKNRVWVGSDTTVHNQIISSLHDSHVGGHSGIPVTCR
jgi:hypothetical protein